MACHCSGMVVDPCQLIDAGVVLVGWHPFCVGYQGQGTQAGVGCITCSDVPGPVQGRLVCTSNTSVTVCYTCGHRSGRQAHACSPEHITAAPSCRGIAEHFFCNTQTGLHERQHAMQNRRPSVQTEPRLQCLAAVCCQEVQPTTAAAAAHLFTHASCSQASSHPCITWHQHEDRTHSTLLQRTSSLQGDAHITT